VLTYTDAAFNVQSVERAGIPRPQRPKRQTHLASVQIKTGFNLHPGDGPMDSKPCQAKTTGDR
jgi:hypothetical protein